MEGRHAFYAFVRARRPVTQGRQVRQVRQVSSRHEADIAGPYDPHAKTLRQDSWSRLIPSHMYDVFSSDLTITKP